MKITTQWRQSISLPQGILGSLPKVDRGQDCIFSRAAIRPYGYGSLSEVKRYENRRRCPETKSRASCTAKEAPRSPDTAVVEGGRANLTLALREIKGQTPVRGENDHSAPQ